MKTLSLHILPYSLFLLRPFGRRDGGFYVTLYEPFKSTGNCFLRTHLCHWQNWAPLSRMALLAVAQRTALALIPFAIIAFYIHWNDKALKRIPASVLYFSPKRCSAQDVRAMAESLANSPPISIKDKQNMPPKTGRRYIVVGGVRLTTFIYIYI